MPLYIGARITGTITMEGVEGWSTKVFDSERTDSLAVRLYQEDLFSARAMHSPWFGWGRSSRAWPVDPHTGEPLIRMVDSLWIINFSNKGLFGVVTWMTGMLIGPWLVLRRITKATTQKNESSAVMGVMLSLIVIIFMIDSLFNGMVNPIYIMVSGALAGWYLATDIADQT